MSDDVQSTTKSLTLLSLLAQAAVIIAALLYVSGWSYLGGYFGEFSIDVSETGFGVVDYALYSIEPAGSILSAIYAPFSIQLLAFFLLALFLGIELLTAREAFGPRALTWKAPWPASWLKPPISTVLGIIGLALMFLIVAQVSRDAGQMRGRRVKNFEVNIVHVDFVTEGNASSDCQSKTANVTEPVTSTITNDLEIVGTEERSQWRLFCRIGGLDRRDELKFVWRSDATVYLLHQPTRRGKPSGAPLMFRVPASSVRAIEIMKPI